MDNQVKTWDIKDWSYDGIMDEILHPKRISILARIKNELKMRINRKMGKERLLIEKV